MNENQNENELLPGTYTDEDGTVTVVIEHGIVLGAEGVTP